MRGTLNVRLGTILLRIVVQRRTPHGFIAGRNTTMSCTVHAKDIERLREKALRQSFSLLAMVVGALARVLGKEVDHVAFCAMVFVR